MMMTGKENDKLQYHRRSGKVQFYQTIDPETAGGRSLSRVGLNEVNKAVENGEIQYLLVKDISRLGRVMPQVMDYVDWLNSHGVELICADGTSYSVEESKVNDQINAEMSRLSV